MDIYRELKDIGNEYLPLRLYSIAINQQTGMDIEIFSGFGDSMQKELWRNPCFISHWHSYFELIYFIEGEHFNVFLNSRHLRAGAGDLVLINQYDIHNVIGEGRFIVINIDPIQIFSIKNCHENIFPSDTAVKLLSTRDNHSKSKELLITLRDRVGEIYRLYQEKPVGYTLHVKGKMYEILGDIWNYSHYANSDGQAEPVNMEILDKLNQVVKYIKGNYTRVITLNEVAKVLNFTPNYFCRFFKKNMGRTFFEYLNQYRCLQAETLLKTTNMTITDIAYEVGFSSISYFDKVYKKTKGYKPSKEGSRLRKLDAPEVMEIKLTEIDKH